jgi:hypothetical protein
MLPRTSGASLSLAMAKAFCRKSVTGSATARRNETDEE